MAAVSRRTFLHTTTTAAAAASLLRAPRLRAAQAAARGSVVTTLPLATFPYADVQLLDGPMKRQFDENHERFLHLDDDRMLKVFRQVAGMRAPGEDMGGWYDLTGFNLDTNDFNGFIAGHSFGQYVSALARAYAVTGSEPTRDKVNRLVKGYADTLDDKAIFFKGYRLPAYTYDKLSCGLIDAHEFARDPLALDVHEKLTRAMTAYLPEKALSRAEQRMRPGGELRLAWTGKQHNNGPHLGFGGYIGPHTSTSGIHFNAWATTADLDLTLGPHLEFSGNGYRGQALGGLGGGAYKDYVAGTRSNGEIYFRSLDAVGGWAQLKQKVSERLQFNEAFGIDQVFAKELRAVAGASTQGYLNFARNRTWTANTIYSPTAYLLFSFEYRRVETAPVAGRLWTSNVFGVAAGYRF